MADEDLRLEREPNQTPALIGAAVAAVALLAFIFQNTGKTEVKWLFLTIDLPLWALLVVTSAIAIVGAQLVAWILRRRRQ